MKKGRSNTFTTGLCNTFDKSEFRCFFFEIDDPTHYDRITEFYFNNDLDVLTHRTGSGGYHFISPTMINKEKWKSLMLELKDINPKCPMTTLRVEPNKYPNESELWYRYETWTHDQDFNNNKEMCIYLNHIFKSNLKGILNGGMKLVRYPLPLMELKA